MLLGLVCFEGALSLSHSFFFFVFVCFVLVSRYTRKWVWKFVSGDLLDWKQSSKWVSKRRGEKIWREKVEEFFRIFGLERRQGFTFL